MNARRAVGAQDKIRPLHDLARTISELKAQGKCIVHCHGVFDLLHPGHIRHLAAAKCEGDVLVVTVTPDHLVNKGPGRPVFTEELRTETLASLEQVDFVAVNKWPTAVETINLLKPDVYVKGNDYADRKEDVTGKINDEEAAVLAVGGRIHFTNDITFSSSKLLNTYLSVFPPHVGAYLQDFRKRHSAREIVNSIEAFKSLKVMVIGEAILDEYVYGDVIGKSAKEPILALRYVWQEKHVGGSLAIANHLADFCESVELVTYLGEKQTHEEFVRESLKENVHPHFVYKSNSPTIVKRRFVENYLVTKLLEIYEMDDELLSGREEETLNAILEEQLPRCDLVIAADYGHGLIGRKTIDLLCEKASFLAVNTQINAANIGFHTLSRYPRANYACVHEGEIRLDLRNRRGDLRSLVERLAERLRSDSVMVTQGKHGTLLYRPGEGFFECPAFSVKVIDRVGAGDAVLALTSLCAAQRLPPDVIGFIGNMVGAAAVTIIGNRSSIDRVQLLKGIDSIMK